MSHVSKEAEWNKNTNQPKMPYECIIFFGQKTRWNERNGMIAQL